jgi:membrane protein implicated in regulation of membrane protease activity
MTFPRWAVFLLVLPGLVLCLLLAGVFFFALAVLPPWVSTVALCIMALFVLWLFGRRKSTGPATEGGLMGRQKSTGGLL